MWPDGENVILVQTIQNLGPPDSSPSKFVGIAALSE